MTRHTDALRARIEDEDDDEDEYGLLRLSASQCAQNLPPIRTAQTCRRIPTRAGAKSSIISRNNIIERRRILIQRSVYKPSSRFAFLYQCLIDSGEKPCVKGRHGAGPTNRVGTPVDDDLISGYRIRIPGDIGYPAASSLGGWRRDIH